MVCGGSLVAHQTSETERGHGFESGTSHNDHDALHDHCELMYILFILFSLVHMTEENVCIKLF